MTQQPKDINGTPINTGDIVKMYDPPMPRIQWRNAENKYGFQNGIGTVTKIEENYWVCVNNSPWGHHPDILKIIPQNLYQHILRSI